MKTFKKYKNKSLKEKKILETKVKDFQNLFHINTTLEWFGPCVLLENNTKLLKYILFSKSSFYWSISNLTKVLRCQTC